MPTIQQREQIVRLAKEDHAEFGTEETARVLEMCETRLREALFDAQEAGVFRVVSPPAFTDEDVFQFCQASGLIDPQSFADKINGWILTGASTRFAFDTVLGDDSLDEFLEYLK